MKDEVEQTTQLDYHLAQKAAAETTIASLQAQRDAHANPAEIDAMIANQKGIIVTQDHHIEDARRNLGQLDGETAAQQEAAIPDGVVTLGEPVTGEVKPGEVVQSGSPNQAIADELAQGAPDANKETNEADEQTNDPASPRRRGPGKKFSGN